MLAPARSLVIPGDYAWSRNHHSADNQSRAPSLAMQERSTALPRPDVTFILATHNRRDILLRTLDNIITRDAMSASAEIIVVDNASTDDTPRAVAQRFGLVRVIARRDNLGSCAKSVAVEEARGQYIVFLDDDSFPRPGCVDRMIQRFTADERLGAAGFVVNLPSGTRECSAFPNVFVGCGVGLRTDALRAVGGLDAGFFMQAEEFDLSFRLVGAGWRVQTFGDLHVDHLKTPQARITARTAYHDTRNNLIIVDRYLTDPYHRIYRDDWTRRYGWLATMNGHRSSFIRARLAARMRASRERHRFRDQRLTPRAFEKLFRIDEITQRMAALHRDGVHDVLFADLGKNVYAFHQAARRAGIRISAILDDRFAGRGYRGVPIVPATQLTRFNTDAVVVSNTAGVHADVTRDRISKLTQCPVHRWFPSPTETHAEHIPASSSAIPADVPATNDTRSPDISTVTPVSG